MMMIMMQLMILMVVSTCWCCRALLGCLRTGGEPRPRCASDWIWHTGLEDSMPVA